MNIIVTGGSGFIGSALIRFLIQETKHSVLNIDKFTYAAQPGSLKCVESHRRYRFKCFDICDGQALSDVMLDFQPDAVFHLAAESHVDNSIANPSAFLQTNIIGTYQLLECTRRYLGIATRSLSSGFKFIHVSTDEVFGEITEVDQQFKERSPYKPSSPYSASKASAGHLVRAWYKTLNVPSIVTSCSNNYGPFQHSEKLIPKVIRRAIQGATIPIYGNGQQVRDWIYGDDHVKGLYATLMQGKIGETYLFGGANQRSNVDLVTSVCRALDKLRPASALYETLIEHVDDRAGHDICYSVDFRSTSQKLGWLPETPMDVGLNTTLCHYLTF